MSVKENIFLDLTAFSRVNEQHIPNSKITLSLTSLMTLATILLSIKI